MQYIVETAGNVIEQNKKVYVISAKDAETAQDEGKRRFADENELVSEQLSVQTRKRTSLALISFLCLIIPIGLSFISWKDGHSSVDITPDFISSFFSIVIYLGYIIRYKGFSNYILSAIDVMLSIAQVLVLSSLLKVILIQKEIKIAFVYEANINTIYILIAVAILIWVGLKTFGLLGVAVIVFVSTANLIKINSAMGMWGTVYIISVFVGILTYIFVDPYFISAIRGVSVFTGKQLLKVKDRYNDIPLIKK